MLLQAQNEDEYQKRVEFCESFVIRAEADPVFENCNLWLEETAFKTNGIVNRYNCV